MSHIFSPHTASPVMLQTPTPSSVITPAQQPVAGTSPSGGTTPSFLGSSVLPPQAPGGGQANQKKLLGS